MKRFVSTVFSIVLLSACTSTQTPNTPSQTVSKDGKRQITGCPSVDAGGAKFGKVVMLIDVDQDGKASNIRIVESEPKGIWDENAICITKLNIFRKNDKGAKPPFQDFRHELIMKIND